ncbi:hypothetical protein LSTR_LSTR002123 [Laodelphax striatellus]|uniref:Uncharacterized protein n=1 Tax=Laodelphax striatellus TaxID=195883 RepID=A0A482XR85_LAOST|nr:hypothetical protein LSTR_LSTR002123 [Laodelphax striatellus]
MRLIEYGEARRILILYIIISTIITESESRNIQEQNELHPPAVNAVTNLMGELKDKLNNLLSSVRQDSINDDKGTQERSSNVYDSTRNFPNEDFSQYRHLATPHPTLQDDGLLYDYDDNSIDNHETGKVHHDSNKKEVGTTDEIGIDGNAGESGGENGKKEDPINEIWIPDCDIPPYPDMLQRKGINFPEEDDEVGEDSDKTDDADVG